MFASLIHGIFRASAYVLKARGTLSAWGDCRGGWLILQ